MCISLLLLTTVVSLVAGAPQAGGRQIDAQIIEHGFDCLEDGLFEDYDQCDLYWECKSGVATPQLCDDGLVFDPFKARAGHADPCDTPLVIDCSERPLMQEPTYPNKFCPRRHGIFADPDETICARFHTCKEGHKESTTDCSAGLHFSLEQSICTWPVSAGRANCVDNPSECFKSGNFCCTNEQVFAQDGMLLPHPTYVNPDDCQRFYVCLNGKIPQESACPLGRVFNDKTLVCDSPDNVPECKDYYINHPLYDVLYDDANIDAVRKLDNQRNFPE